MSIDRTTEILNYLSAISREVGELRTDMNSIRTEVNTLRTEVNTLRTEMNARLERIEAEVTRIGREQRLQGRRLDRIESLLLTTRADIDELQERVDALEGKQA